MKIPKNGLKFYDPNLEIMGHLKQKHVLYQLYLYRVKIDGCVLYYFKWDFELNIVQSVILTLTALQNLMNFSINDGDGFPQLWQILEICCLTISTQL